MSSIEIRFTGRIIQFEGQKISIVMSLGHSGRQSSRQAYGRNVAGGVDRGFICILNLSENVF